MKKLFKKIEEWWEGLQPETAGNIAALAGVIVWAAIIVALAYISQNKK